MPHPTPHQRLTRTGLSAQFADLVLAEHAHELAEEIRREGGHRLCHHDCKDYDANLIDPTPEQQR